MCLLVTLKLISGAITTYIRTMGPYFPHQKRLYIRANGIGRHGNYMLGLDY